MASIASNVQWGSAPIIYFDFSYEKKRDGSTQYYQITVSCDPITGSHYFGYPIYVQISLDGAVKTSYTLKDASPSQWSTAKSNTTGWLAVSNKTEGTTSLAIKIYSGSGSSRNTTYTYNLAIDPAASKISCTKANIEEYPTITIAKASPDFTHTITYGFNGINGTIATKTSATTITNWMIPADFYAKIPNDKTGRGGLQCDTYDANGKYVGNSTCNLDFGTNESKCKPSVSGTVADANQRTIDLTGDENVLVRYKSEALCTITASSPTSGRITEKTINNAAVSGDTLRIYSVETDVFDFWAKDSREYSNSDKVTKELIPYIKLTANVTGHRTDPTSGNATLTIKGNYFEGSFGAQENWLQIYYKQGNGEWTWVTPTISNNEYTATVSLSGLDYTKAFDFHVSVSDKLDTVNKFITIPKGIPVFDWGENDFNFNVPISINGTAVDYIVEQGTSGIWTYRKWNSGIAECWGISDSVTADISVAWGSMFAKDDAIPNYSYPFSFVGMPTLSITPRRIGGSNFWVYAGYGASETRTPTVSLVRPTQMEVEAAVDYYVIGRWKG